MPRLDWLTAELANLEARHLRRTLRTRGGAQGATIELEGRTVVNFGSNDYLGLAAERRLVAAAAAAIESDGWGSGASPLIVGRGVWHAELEKRLAQFEGVDSALLFNTGFAANAGAITALVGREDGVFSDELNHASIVDGCRLSRAELHIYPHADMDRLATMLRVSGSRCRRRLIVSDTLFSMEGDLAPLDMLAELATRHDAMLMVDEAHASGVFGVRGRGVAEMFGSEVEDRIDIRVGTLSKAFGCSGGFVAGSRSLIDWLLNRARPYVFSTAAPAAGCVAALAALEIVERELTRRTELLARAAQLRSDLQADGWNTGQSASQIIPIIIGEAAQAVGNAKQLLKRGLFVPAIRPPSVPEGRSLLRISLSFAHTSEMIDRLVVALRDLKG